MSETEYRNVEDADDGQRLDRWLKKEMKGVPFGLLQKMMRTGQVRVDGCRAKPETRLRSGQQVRLPPHQESSTPSSGDCFTDRPDDDNFTKSLVVYDDEDLCVLNKPYGLASQGGPKITRHVDGLLKHLADRKGRVPRLMHRLDRETTGLLMCARSLELSGMIGKALQNREMRKIYLAMTLGGPERDQGFLEAPLIKGSGAHKDRVFVDHQNGKPALTCYQVLERAAKKAALVAFWPRTGRMHQIRAHAAEILGTPILGDARYGGSLSEEFSEDVLGRVHLHAAMLVLRHPLEGKKLTLHAPLPEVFRQDALDLGFSPPKRLYDPFEWVQT